MKTFSLVVRTSEGLKLHELGNKNIIMMGRSPGNDIVIDGKGSQYVSRVHCGIVVKEDGIYIFDNQSTNGTVLNEVSLKPREMYQLKEGDKILIGFNHEFIFGVNQDSKKNLEAVI